MASIRDMEPPPHIAGIKHFTSFALVDEILRSKDFRQGSHQESQPFFGDSLLTIDHDRHFERRRMEAHFFARTRSNTTNAKSSYRSSIAHLPNADRAAPTTAS